MLAVSALSLATGEQIHCETIRIEPWAGIGDKKSCSMQKSTSIDSNDVTIPPDLTIETLSFGGNKKIKFLPVQVAASFPFLKGYAAGDCSIKNISKVHFKGLIRC